MSLFGRSSGKTDTRELSYRQWFARQHPLALVSLLLSAFSLTHFGTLWVDEVLGIVLGVITLKQLARARREMTGMDTTDPASGRTEGDWLAWAGIVVGVISLGCAVTVYFVLRPHG